MKEEKEKMKRVNLFMRPSDMERAAEIAEKKAVRRATLIRKWVREGIEREKKF